MASLEDTEEVSIAEIVELGATDTGLFGSFFFPKAIRMKTPPCHRELDNVLDTDSNRFVNARMWRGGAKTTKLRVFTAKRISYALARTIIFVGKSQDHAKRSVKWLMRNVEYNSLWAQTFQLSKGSTWTSEELEIIHGIEGIRITVIALGITGSTRGINVEDYRPDLIVVDDPCDEENTATPEARQKLEDIFFGALEKSLAPVTEAPHAKMVLLQTPLNEDDLVHVCDRDPGWASLDYGCFDENGESRWPERWSTKTLKDDKESHVARGQLSLWMREMECKIISRELAAWQIEVLQYWEVLPEGMLVYLGIDPTPPPKDNTAIRVVTTKKRLDDAAIVAIGSYGGKVFLIDYYVTKSPDPEEFLTKIFEFALRYHPFAVTIETHFYQRTLKTALEDRMQRTGKFLTIFPLEDKRKKETRIRQAIGNRVGIRSLYVHKSHLEFIQQFAAYPNVNHDDLLDAASIALSALNPAMEGITLEGEFAVLDESDIPELEEWRGAP